MRHAPRTFALAVVIAGSLLWPARAADASETASTSPAKKPRWESNLSIGGVSEGRLAIVKSFWWFPVPKIVALGLSFDYIYQFLPLSLNVAVSAPIPVFVPFVCAGAGAGLTGGNATSYGGGLKIRLLRKFGLIVEYRKYHYRPKTPPFQPPTDRVSTNYFGAGIAWVY
jgi:hypothetical protein